MKKYNTFDKSTGSRGGCTNFFDILSNDALPDQDIASAMQLMPSQTPFVKLSFNARRRSPVFTIIKMRCPYLLVFSGTVARAIVAAEVPRPRGVGPECSIHPQSCITRVLVY